MFSAKFFSRGCREGGVAKYSLGRAAEIKTVSLHYL